jgi:signal transduction histidine kinase/CheY-like chemotaxis protein
MFRMNNIYDVLHSLGPLEVNITENLINLIPGNVFVVDTNGYLLWGNQRILDILHLTNLDEYVGKHISYWDKYSWECCKEIIKSGKEIVGEEFYQGHYYLTNRKPLFSVKKELVAILGTALDVTEQKQAEIAKQEFLMNMAHDLRTPLAGIIGLSSIQSREITDNQNKNQWMWVHDAGEQLLELLNSVIELTAAEHIIDRVKQERIDLTKLAEELYNLMQPIVQSKNLTFQLKIDPQLPIIISDRIKLKRILLNILSNALKFTKQGKISLKINLLSIANKQAKIKIIITDTGIGIPKDKLEKIFDRFYRVHPSYRTEYSGYGIGLYLVKETTKALAGKISVFSEEEKGSRFTLEFNFALADPDSKLIVPNSSELIVESEVLTDQHRGTVLVAEDNSLVLYAVNKMLLSLGYRAITVSSGEAALHALQTKTCDWALLDIGLPDLDGMEVTRHCREWEKVNNKPHLPIFALTAHAEKKIKDQCKKVGFDEVLEKPFTEKDLKRIEKFLKKIKL